MNKKKVYIKTYGCQMNVYDSSRMMDVFNSLGYEATDVLTQADIIVLNTCHIREKASEKMYSYLGQINALNKRLKRSQMIIVGGCVAQAEGDKIFKRAPYVDIVVGPQSYHKLPELLRECETKRRVQDLELAQQEKFKRLLHLPRRSSKSEDGSAFVTIQEGCNKKCKYCVVPYTRGEEFSRPVTQVFDEVLQLTAHGVKEIFLLGQNVNAYHGKDEAGTPTSLASLIKKIADIPEIQRIRYMTSHPINMTSDLIEAHGSVLKLMPQLHLPVQSGSNKVLKDMNRYHTVEKYLSIIDKLRAVRPDITFSSDFIVGYPGETDEDFEQTLKLLETVKFAQVYSFKYSPRPGTPAAELPQIPEAIKDERLQRLQAIAVRHQREFNAVD